MKSNENKQDVKTKHDKVAKPNSNMKVKGKRISDFLTKKKLERAARGICTNDASHTQRSQGILPRDQLTDTGEPTPIPNQRIQGLEIAAKGNTVSDVTPAIGQNKPDEM